MKILRLIKIKHLSGDFDELGDMERLFFSLFNNLYEKSGGGVCYIFDKSFNLKFEYYESANYISLSYSHFHLKFSEKYGMSESDSLWFIRSTLEKYLNFNLLTAKVEYT